MWKVGVSKQLITRSVRGVPPAQRGSHKWSAEAYKWLGGFEGWDDYQGRWVEGWRASMYF